MVDAKVNDEENWKKKTLLNVEMMMKIEGKFQAINIHSFICIRQKVQADMCIPANENVLENPNK